MQAVKVKSDCKDNKKSVNFSQSVKAELSKIRETGREYKNAYDYGLSYGVKNEGAAESVIIDRVLGGNDEIGGIFMRGVFVSCGSVSSPEKEYHLELVPPNDEKCNELLEFTASKGLNLKKSKRKVGKNAHSQSFLYCKECEQIADFLTFIGAVKHSMELMNVIILKEIRNNVNRVVNCESANIEKTARAAGKQIRDIEYVLEIEKKRGKPVLTKELRDVAVIRRANMGMSLSEIGKELKPPISKSGVNHRLNRISEIAKQLMSEN